MYITEEELMNVPYKLFNKRGLQVYLGTSVPESTFSYKIDKELKELYEKYGVSRLKYLYFEMHGEEIRSKAKESKNYYDLEKLTGIPYNVLKNESVRYNFKLRSNPSFLNQETRDKLSNLFMGPKYSSIESYYYGYYLGDGFENKREDGSSISIGILCCCEKDYDNFRLLEKYMNCGEFMRPINRNKGYKLEIREKEVVDRLKDRGLLFNSKCNNHPKFNKSMLDDFDFMMLLRGLIDSDGTVTKSVERGEYRIKVRMVCENIVKSVYEKLLDIGVYCNFYSYEHKGYQDVYYLNIPGRGMSDLLKLGVYDKYQDLYIERKKIETPDDIKRKIVSMKTIEENIL